VSVRIRLPALLADRIDGVDTVEVTATTVKEALHALTQRHAELATLVWTAGGTLNPAMVLFLNDRKLTTTGPTKAVYSGDELDIIPAIEGG
jgi:molybdopterin converting factor small subunit